MTTPQSDGAIAAGATTGPSASANVGGISLVAPTGGTGTDVFGLGTAVAGAKVDISGLPGMIQAQILGQKVPINTIQDLMTALAHIKDPATVAYLQQLLYYAGKYSSTTTMGEAQSGIMDDATVSALKTLATTTAQTNAPFGTYLTQAANFGKATGDINAAAGVGKQVLGIAHPSTIDADSALRSTAQQLLGHDPSAQDYAGFRAFYDQVYTAGQKAQIQAQNAANASSGAYGDPQTLASAYGVQQQRPLAPYTDQSATTAEHNQVNNAALAGDQAAAGQYVDSLNLKANQGPPVVNYSTEPSAGAAAEQFLQQQDGPDVGAQKNTEVTKSLLSILAGKGY